MQLFVFSIKQCKQDTLINATALIYQLKVLLGAGQQLWEDEDAPATIREDEVCRDYLEPNNIPVLKMGRLPQGSSGQPRFWVLVDDAKLKFDDFYTYEEALQQNVFAADSGALCWKTYYIFLNADDKTDIIGNSNYMGSISEVVHYVLGCVVNASVASASV